MKSRTSSVPTLWQAMWLSLGGAMLGAFCAALAQESHAQEHFAPLRTAPPKVTRYVAALLARHDRNGDGRLEPDEWREMQGSPETIDRDHDGDLVASELSAHVMAYARARMPVSQDDGSEEASSTQDYLPPPLIRPDDSSPSTPSGMTGGDDAAATGESTGDGPATSTQATAPRTTKFVVRPSRATHNLPEWFLSLDTDGDRQLTLREFGPDSAGRSREFERLDHNGDGLLTPQEITATPSPER